MVSRDIVWRDLSIVAGITALLLLFVTGAAGSAFNRTYAAGDFILAPAKIYLAIWDYTEASYDCYKNTTLLKEGYMLSLDSVYFLNTPAKDGMWGTSIRIGNFSLYKNGEVVKKSNVTDGELFYYNMTINGRQYSVIEFKVDGIFNADGGCSGILVQLRPFKQYSDGTATGGQEFHASAPGVSPSEEWNRTLGRIDDESVMSVQETGDGGYFIARSITPAPGTKWYGVHILLNRTDANGSELWNRTISEQNAQIYSIQPTADNGFAVAGDRIETGHFDRDAWLVKIDPNGSQQWRRTYGGEYDDTSSSVQETGDGGYILSGLTGESVEGIRLIRTDHIGKVLWNKTLGRSTNFDRVSSIRQTADGGYIIATIIPGQVLDYYYDSRLIRVDQNGNEIWSRRFGEKYDDRFFSVQETVDGGYIAAGVTESYGHDAWLIKTNANGDEQWNRTFYVAGGSEALDVQLTSDGYILAGRRLSYDGNDALLIKTDSNGNEQWNKTFGGERDDEALYVRQTGKGGYILAGTTKSYGSGNKDAWLVKVSREPDDTANAPAKSTVEPSSSTRNKTAVPEMTASYREKAAGFEVVLAIMVLLALYVPGRKRR